MAVRNVEIIRASIIKPSPHPHRDSLCPLTVFDLANHNSHIPTLYAFLPPMPDDHDLIQGLKEALFHYPHLAGSFSIDRQGHPCILLDDHGVRVIETQIPTSLEQHLPLDPADNLMNLVPPVMDAEELCQVQLNRFGCGGLVIGLTTQHRVADGLSISSFVTTWAKMVSGRNISALPYHDRAAVTIPRSPPTCEFPHGAIEFRNTALSGPELIDDVVASSRLRIASAHFSPAFILTLKNKVAENLTGDDEKRRCSTFECVLAHVWKRITLARGLHVDGHGIMKVRTSVNGRARVKPPVPMEYFGNYVLWAFPKMQVTELLTATYGEVVDLIRKAVAAVDDGYFKSCIDFGELMKNEKMVNSLPAVGESLCPDLEFNSWMGLKFTDMDFGSGRPCAFLPPSLPVEGLTILIPSCEEDGGVDVYVSLAKEHAATFKELCCSLE